MQMRIDYKEGPFKQCANIICALLLLLLMNWSIIEANKYALATDTLLKVNLNKGLLSIEAERVTAEDILREICKVCDIEMKNFGKVFSSDLVSIRYSNLEPKEGIKKIIKMTGVNNYCLHYKEVNNSDKLYAIDFFGEGTTLSVPEKSSPELLSSAVNTKQVNKEIKEKDNFKRSFEETMEEFRNKYKWDNNDTQELASYLMEKMPEQVRDAGIKSTMKKLDQKIEKGDQDTVDEGTFLKAIEETLSPKMAPRMMNYIKSYVNEYKGEVSEH
jgi:hypothetical protein